RQCRRGSTAPSGLADRRGRAASRGRDSGLAQGTGEAGDGSVAGPRPATGAANRSPGFRLRTASSPLLRPARQPEQVAGLAVARKIHGFDSLAAPGDAGARSADARKILLRLAEMRLEFSRALGQQSHVVDQLADLGLDR